MHPYPLIALDGMFVACGTSLCVVSPGVEERGVLPLFYLCSVNRNLFPFTRQPPFWTIQGVTKVLVRFPAFIVSNCAFVIWETAVIVTSRLSYTPSMVHFSQKSGLLQIALVRENITVQISLSKMKDFMGAALTCKCELRL